MLSKAIWADIEWALFRQICKLAHQVKPEIFNNAPITCIVYILVLKKNVLHENCIGWWDCINDSTKSEFPHLPIHIRPKSA